MNPVLAGLGVGMIAVAMKLGSWQTFRVRPLSRNPSTDELADQFQARVRRFHGDNVDQYMESFVNMGLDVIGVDDYDTATDAELDSAFQMVGGCKATLRREALVKSDALDQVRAVTRHRNFNPDLIRESISRRCKKKHTLRQGPLTTKDVEECNAWAEEVLGWFDIAHRNLIDYRRLEKRNCPVLIAGLPRRRLAR
jgi:hypothetical protein